MAGARPASLSIGYLPCWPRLSRQRWFVAGCTGEPPPTANPPPRSLAGTNGGIGAEATVGYGIGANALIGARAVALSCSP